MYVVYVYCGCMLCMYIVYVVCACTTFTNICAICNIYDHMCHRQHLPPFPLSKTRMYQFWDCVGGRVWRHHINVCGCVCVWKNVRGMHYVMYACFCCSISAIFSCKSLRTSSGRLKPTPPNGQNFFSGKVEERRTVYAICAASVVPWAQCFHSKR